jgi:predicted dithiol-disulfide oxidoreductase (DUF899 family)
MSAATQIKVTDISNEPRIATHREWLAARKDFLTKEKQLTRLRDDLARQRRELPWERVEQNYIFGAPHSRVTLAELFRGKSQLAIYHFMLGPDWPEGCPGCSLAADGFTGSIPHLEQRDVAFAAVSRAPISQIEAFRKRMGWNFNWVSSLACDFNFDYGVSFTPEQTAAKIPNYNYETAVFTQPEAPGLSVFARKGAEIFHTYSTYGRGLEPLLGVYHLLDWTPVGRGEEGLSMPMSWVRHHDKYENAPAGLPACCDHPK